jgi:hypothetical protein
MPLGAGQIADQEGCPIPPLPVDVGEASEVARRELDELTDALRREGR